MENMGSGEGVVPALPVTKHEHQYASVVSTAGCLQQPSSTMLLECSIKALVMFIEVQASVF